jgi:hypothetical protein
MVIEEIFVVGAKTIVVVEPEEAVIVEIEEIFVVGAKTIVVVEAVIVEIEEIFVVGAKTIVVVDHIEAKVTAEVMIVEVEEGDQEIIHQRYI